MQKQQQQMDLSSALFDAAIDGSIPKQLQRVLESKTREELRKIVGQKLMETTALIIACTSGRLAVVKFLIEKCFADVEQVGAVTVGDKYVEAAPPLWCAAALNKLEIVQYLATIETNLNSTTETGSNALNVACSKGYFHVVRILISRKADIEIANRQGITCLMKACYKGHIGIMHLLIGAGADINRKCDLGTTALHSCAMSGNLYSLKKLLGLNAHVEKDVHGVTPLLAAAMMAQEMVVMHILKCNNCPTDERIKALELLGAAYVDDEMDMNGAVRLWKKAMHERQSKDYYETVREEPHAAYMWAVEAQTEEELNNLVGNPNDIRMQALLIRERILGPAHPHTSIYIMQQGAEYLNNGQTERGIDLWMYGLNMQQRSFPPLCELTQSSFFVFAEHFLLVMSDINSDADFTNRYILIGVFEKLVMEAKRVKAAMKKTNNGVLDLETFFNTTMLMLKLLCDAEKQMSKEEVFRYKKLANQLVELKLQTTLGCTLMHFAFVEIYTNDTLWYSPTLKVLELLVEVGGDVNCRDAMGNTPLHVAALSRPCNGDIINTLLRAGAHVDSVNDDNISPQELLPADTACELLFPLKFQTLQCLAAKAVRRYNLVYENVLSPELSAFVKNH